MELWLFIVLNIIIVVISTIRFGVTFTYNILSNIGHIKITIFGIPIFSKDITFYISPSNITNKNVLHIKLNFKHNSFEYFKSVVEEIVGKIYLQKIQLISYVGIKENAYSTSLITGYNSVIYSGMQSYIKSLNLDTNLDFKINTNWLENNLSILANSTIYISIYDIIWCVLYALIKRRTYGQRSKQTS